MASALHSVIVLRILFPYGPNSNFLHILVLNELEGRKNKLKKERKKKNYENYFIYFFVLVLIVRVLPRKLGGPYIHRFVKQYVT